jgi:hypothetical protein
MLSEHTAQSSCTAVERCHGVRMMLCNRSVMKVIMFRGAIPVASAMVLPVHRDCEIESDQIQQVHVRHVTHDVQL